jgi:hypothetical protein
VTTNPPGTPLLDPVTGNPVAGALVPGGNTTVLFGDDTVNQGGRSGAQITLGMWLDCRNTWGLEGDYFDLGRKNTTFDSGCSNGTPILARPFFNTTLGVPDAEIVAFPGLLAGNVSASASDYFQSAGLHLRRNLFCCECDGCAADCGESTSCQAASQCDALRAFRLDLLAGYRNYQLSDDVMVHESLVVIGGREPVGTRYDIIDSFRTRNSFNGGEFGLAGNFIRGRWSLGLTAKASLGSNHEVVDINGSTTITTAAGTTLPPEKGGLLALQTNINSYSRNEFVVIPELGTEIGYQLTCHLRAFVGYDLLYWGQVARAGDQINLNIDTNNIPPAQSGAGPDPTFAFHQTSFWAQGLRLGAELRF